MTTPTTRSAIALAVASACALHAQAQSLTHIDQLETIVVTAPSVPNPLINRLNPRSAQQPLPANDGASLLKVVPGMSVIRKGGTDGDLVFRGMAASRLNVLIDGEQILGGCGMRMDPPTAYVFPDAFDRVTLIKGPQSVAHGAGASAGTVLFERDDTKLQAPGSELKGALTLASFGRLESFVDARVRHEHSYASVIGTYARSDDYQDGDGNFVHAAYERSSLTGVFGWTPDDTTRLELSAIRSRGEAAYGDRSMDGSRFDRRNIGFKFDKTRLLPKLQKLQFQVYRNEVDHVMDNFSLRTPPASSAAWMASNPDRQTQGGKLVSTWVPDDIHQIVLGIDQQTNKHTIRSSGMGGEQVSPYDQRARMPDAQFDNLGVFGEVSHAISDERRLMLGLRHDHWQAADLRSTLNSGMMSLGANPTAGLHRSERMNSGFIRFEQDWGQHTQSYIGLGQTVRSPDYWEIISKEAANSTSAFDQIQPEQTRQLDFGVTHQQGPWKTFGSAYISRVEDFILIQSGVTKTMGMSSRSATIARNIDASTWGFEAGVHYLLNANWQASSTLAYVNGQNLTDDVALGQMSPLESRWGLNWQSGAWSAGGLLRWVAAQNRYTVGQGNVVGQDIGATPGFGTVSLNASYKPNEAWQWSLGVDNLGDKTYAEAINRAGAAVAGYEQTTRIHEPGRTWWMKVQAALQ